MARDEIPRPGLLPGELLPLAEAGRRLGLSRSWLRRARLSGLRVHAVGKKRFVESDDLLRFIREQSSSGATDTPPRDNGGDR